MLSKNLIGFRRVLMIGIILATAIAKALPLWQGIASGQVAFIFFILMIGAYLFEVAFYSIRDKHE